jgi:hypothetical protein
MSAATWPVSMLKLKNDTWQKMKQGSESMCRKIRMAGEWPRYFGLRCCWVSIESCQRK